MIVSGIITLISFKYIPFKSDQIKATSGKEIHPNRRKLPVEYVNKLENKKGTDKLSLFILMSLGFE